VAKLGIWPDSPHCEIEVSDVEWVMTAWMF